MSEQEQGDQNESDEVRRLRVRPENIGSELGSQVGQSKIRRKRKRVKESRDASFRKGGKTEQDLFDPESSLGEREEDAWVKSKRGQSKKAKRKQIWTSVGIGGALILSVIGIFIYQNSKKEREEKSLGELILEQEAQLAEQAKTPVEDAMVAERLSKAELISTQLPAIRVEALANLDVIRGAESVEEIEKVTRDYPGRRADIAEWLKNAPAGDKPNDTKVYLRSVVADGVPCVQMMGELLNFKYFVSYLVEENGTWLFDWESFIGKCEIPIKTLAEEGSEGPVRVRGMISNGKFYTPPLINDKDYACYLVRSLEETEYIWVYTPRDGRLDKELQYQITGGFVGFDKGNNVEPTRQGLMRAFRLRLKPFVGAILDSQFELVGIDGHGWLDSRIEEAEEADQADE